MKKLTVMVLALVMVCAVLGGCYAKTCDTTCPGAKASMHS